MYSRYLRSDSFLIHFSRLKAVESGLLLAVPYGILAESRGKRFVAALGLTGQMLGDTWILVICKLSLQMCEEIFFRSYFMRILTSVRA